MLILCTIVYQKAVGVGAPQKGAPSTTPESTKMPAKEEQDNVEPSTFIAAHAYSGYAYLFGRGYTLDFIQFLLKYLLFWRKELSVSSPRLTRTSPWLNMSLRTRSRRSKPCVIEHVAWQRSSR